MAGGMACVGEVLADEDSGNWQSKSCGIYISGAGSAADISTIWESVAGKMN
jgi:hypothetical protein